MDINQLIQAIQTEYQSGDKDKALHFSRTLGRKLADMPKAVYPYAICLFFEGRILVDNDDLIESEVVLKKCVEIYENIGKIDDSYYVMALLALADTFFKSHKNQDSKALYNKVIESKIYGDDIGLKTKIFHKYAVISERNRNYEDAINWYEKYLEAFSKLHNDKAPNYLEFYRYKEKLKLALKAKKINYKGDFIDAMGFIHGAFPNGDSTMMDIQYAEYLVSDLPDPLNKDISECINLGAGVKYKYNKSEATIILTDQNKSELIDCLKIKEIDAGHLMKNPDIGFAILDNNSNEVCRIEYFEEGMIRIKSKWKPDAELIDNRRLINWINQ